MTQTGATVRAEESPTGAVGRPFSSWLAWALLTLSVVVAFPLFAWMARGRFGADGLTAVVIAALICWASASLAMFVTLRMNRGPNAAVGILLGMLIRMGVPLAAGVILTSRIAWLAEARLFGQILGFYLVTLAVETALMVKLISSRQKAGVR